MAAAAEDHSLPNHPFAELFPLLEGASFDALVADIKEHGQREKIALWNGEILDGRNRWRACRAAGVVPQCAEFQGTETEALSLVLSLNLHRRHLNESQRAMVAVEVEKLFAKEAKERQRDHGGTAPGKKNTCGKSATSASDDSKARTKAAEALNVSPRLVQDAKRVATTAAPEVVAAVQQGKLAVSAAVKIAAKAPEEQRAIIERVDAGTSPADAIREARREERLDRIASISAGNAPMSLPQRYPVILADPPWRYQLGADFNGAAEGHYPTMSIEEICALPVGEVATGDAILFLWTTSPKLAEAVRALDAWGFTHKTSAVWTKDRIGLGFYFRQAHEFLLVATKGSPPPPRPGDRPSSVIVAPRGGHSEKPAIVHEIIEQMYPTLPKLELFARAPRDGWAAWGNQAGTVAA